MKIVVDAMSGDHAPDNVVEGVIDALQDFDVTIVLVGREDEIHSQLSKFNYPKNRIEVVHADEVVEMHEPASVSIRQKKNSSMSVGVRLLKEEGYNAFISAGNTGAVVAASTINLGLIEGVARPGIGLVLPTVRDVSILIDVGANTAAKPEHLLHYGLMGTVYMKEVIGIPDSKVGLLNIGEESGKGTGFEKESHKLLEESLDNFYGNVEANEIFAGKCRCIVCDGYVGNVVLKVSEGLTESAGRLIKREVKKSPLALFGAWLMKTTLKDIKKLVDYSEYGGAPLLGVNGVVMISHGRSSPKAIKNAIRAAIKEVDHDIIEVMRKEVASHKAEI